jgi:MoxR-like ATPase
MLKLRIGYPAKSEEIEVVRKAIAADRPGGKIPTPDLLHDKRGGPDDRSGGDREGHRPYAAPDSDDAATGDAGSQNTVTLSDIFRARAEVTTVRVSDQILEYAVEIVTATRDPARYGLSDLASLIECGTSPRSSIFLVKAARATAYLHNRGYVIPDDIKSVALPILRHRLRTTYEADARLIDADAILRRILEMVPVP